MAWLRKAPLSLLRLEDRVVPALNFAAPVSFDADNYPWTVAVGDFNGDGKADLATSNTNSNNVSVLLGNGAGSFGAPTNFGVGSVPYYVAVGDFNGDGKIDLVTANRVSNDVSVLLGNGAGGFAPASNFAVGVNIASVAVGDFNGDGKADLVTANLNSSSVSVLLGNGLGAFGAPTNYTVGTNPFFAAVGDFNGDGRADVAVANFTSDSVSMLLSNGLGGFAPAVDFSVGDGPYLVTVGDFNGDGKLDLATPNDHSNDVSVLLGNGAGGFAPKVNYAVGTSPISIAVGDFDGDGKPDLATANYSSNTVSVLLGNGTGSFAPAVNFAGGSEPRSVALGDFNGDGRIDIATGSDHSNKVNVLLNTSIPPALIALSRTTGSIHTIDWVNAAGATLWTIPTAVGYGAATVAVVSDRTGDGYADLFIGNQSGLTNRLGLVDGKTGVELWTTTPYASSLKMAVNVSVGDITGDGKPEVVIAPGQGGGPNVKAYQQNPGPGYNFTMIRNFNAYFYTFVGGVNVAVGDVNRDGTGDIVTGTGIFSNNVRVFNAGVGTSMIMDFFAFSPSFQGGVTVAAGDINGDGYADIITGTQTQGSRIKVFSGNGGLGGGPVLMDFTTSSLLLGVQLVARDFTGSGTVQVVSLTDTNTSIMLNAYSYNGTLAPTTILTKAYAKPAGQNPPVRIG